MKTRDQCSEFVFLNILQLIDAKDDTFVRCFGCFTSRGKQSKEIGIQVTVIGPAVIG